MRQLANLCVGQIGPLAGCSFSDEESRKMCAASSVVSAKLEEAPTTALAVWPHVRAALASRLAAPPSTDAKAAWLEKAEKLIFCVEGAAYTHGKEVPDIDHNASRRRARDDLLVHLSSAAAPQPQPAGVPQQARRPKVSRVIEDLVMLRRSLERLPRMTQKDEALMHLVVLERTIARGADSAPSPQLLERTLSAMREVQERAEPGFAPDVAAIPAEDWRAFIDTHAEVQMLWVAWRDAPGCTYPDCSCEPNGDFGCNSPNAASSPGAPAAQPAPAHKGEPIDQQDTAGVALPQPNQLKDNT